MIATIKGLPVYSATMSEDGDGMVRISLVDFPAVESDFVAFKEAKRLQRYAVQDEERHLVRGVVMRADYPIYRADANGEYWIVYKPETIRRMAEKYLAESRQNMVDTMHNGVDIDGVDMVQFFIKGDGINVEGFDDIADGSLFAEFHVTDLRIWEAIKDGTYKGFSLEGYFGLTPMQRQPKNKYNSMSKISRLKAALAKILQVFGSVTTDKGVLAWDGDEDLKEGDNVYIETAEGERTEAADGDYTTEDGKVIVVVEGKVAEIKDAEAEVAPETEGDQVESGITAEEEVPAPEGEEPAEDEKDKRIAELEAALAEANATIEALKAENEALKGEAENLRKMSAAKPAHEEVKTTASAKATGDKGLDNLRKFLK